LANKRSPIELPLAGILPLTAAVNDEGHLTIAGCDALALAREFGTPLYVFDEETLCHQCRQFRSQFCSRHADSGISYAAKAYLGRALAALLAEEQMGLEVVSGGELAIARSVAFRPRASTSTATTSRRRSCARPSTIASAAWWSTTCMSSTC